MKTRVPVSILCAVCLVGTSVPGWSDTTLASGVQQAQEGDYAAAIATLRGIVERPATTPQAKADLKTAHVYMAVAYVGLGQENEARRAFVAALKLDPALQVTTADFPPRVVRFFERVLQEAQASGEVPRAPRAVAKKSGGSGKKLLLVGGVLAAGAAGVVVATGGGKKNSPPTAGAIAVSPDGVGISSATLFAFSAPSASDPDLNSLTYSWDFGDGDSGTGPNVTHAFAVPGSFAVQLTVSDGQAQASASPVTVTVVSLGGTWVGTQDGITRTLGIIQTRPVLTGTYHNSDCANSTGSIQGQVSNPRQVQFEMSVQCWAATTFTGTADAAGNVLTGTAAGIPLTFRRQ
jgi:hypothetical protein